MKINLIFELKCKKISNVNPLWLIVASNYELIKFEFIMMMMMMMMFRMFMMR